MGASTIYDVKLRYLVEDRATKGVNKLDKSLRRANKSGGLLGSTLRRAGGLAVGFFGLRAAGKALIGYNSALEQTKIQTAGLLQMNLGGTFAERTEQATKVVDRLRVAAAKSTATTAEMAGFMSEIVGPVTAAGLKVKDLANFTAKSVIAAKAMGDEQIAAFDIQQALTKGVEIRDRFTNKLLRSVKMTREEFNKMGTAARLATLQKALASPAIANMAAAQGKSFEGVFSTLKDNIQQVLGQVGLPLFKALTAETKSMVDALSGPEGMSKVNEIAHDLSSTIVSGFKFVKGIMSFIVRHRRLLTLLAKAMLVKKGMGMVSSMVTGISLWGQSLDKAGWAVKIFSTKLGLAAAKIGAVAGVLGAVYMAATEIAGYVDRRQTRTLQAEMEGGSIGDRAQKAAMFAPRQQHLADARVMRTLKELTAAGVIDKAGQVTKKGKVKLHGGDMMSAMRDDGGKTSDLQENVNILRKRAAAAQQRADATKARQDMLNLAQGLGVMTGATQQLTKVMQWKEARDRENFKSFILKFGQETGLSFLAKMLASKAKKAGESVDKFLHAKVDVHRVEIQVESNDPDRFTFGLTQALGDIAKNRGQAFDMERQG